jgi:hypothetical protein
MSPLNVLRTAHACDGTAKPDTRPVRIVRVIRVLRPVGYNKFQVRARVMCADGVIRDATGTVHRLTDPSDTFGLYLV